MPYDSRSRNAAQKQLSKLLAARKSFAGNAIENAFYREARLLTPEQIREGRHAIGYTDQQEFAGCISVAVATLFRWETGIQVQERFWSDMIEAFFTDRGFARFQEERHAN